MKTDYTQALLKTLQDGMLIDTALSGLKDALKKKHHEKLFAPVLLEVLRVLEAEKGTKTAEVRVAKTSDSLALKSQIEAVLQKLGVSKDTPVKEIVDETLIGGFVVTYNHKEHDASYKKSLKSLYESIVK
jgi:F-type H+-transporting ATPase subunit delta